MNKKISYFFANASAKEQKKALGMLKRMGKKSKKYARIYEQYGGGKINFVDLATQFITNNEDAVIRNPSLVPKYHNYRKYGKIVNKLTAALYGMREGVRPVDMYPEKNVQLDIIKFILPPAISNLIARELDHPGVPPSDHEIKELNDFITDMEKMDSPTHFRNSEKDMMKNIPATDRQKAIMRRVAEIMNERQNIMLNSKKSYSKKLEELMSDPDISNNDRKEIYKHYKSYILKYFANKGKSRNQLLLNASRNSSKLKKHGITPRNIHTYFNSGSGFGEGH